MRHIGIVAFGSALWICSLGLRSQEESKPDYGTSLVGLGSDSKVTRDAARRAILSSGHLDLEHVKRLRGELNDLLSKSAMLLSDRDEAVPAIEFFGSNGAAKVLARALDNSDPMVVSRACEHLKKLNQKAVLPEVLRCLEKRNVGFRGAGGEEQAGRLMALSSLISTASMLTGEFVDLSPFDKEGIARFIALHRSKS